METIKKLQLRVKNEYPEGKALGPLKVAEKRVVLYELERSLKKMTSVLIQQVLSFLERELRSDRGNHRNLFDPAPIGGWSQPLLSNCDALPPIPTRSTTTACTNCSNNTETPTFRGLEEPTHQNDWLSVCRGQHPDPATCEGNY